MYYGCVICPAADLKKEGEYMNIKEIDHFNYERFKEGYEDGYKCVMCEEDVELDDSLSCHGYNLVCMRCYYRMVHILNETYLIDEIHKAGFYRLREENENGHN